MKNSNRRDNYVSIDEALRELGFRIFERKGNNEPIWMRNRIRYTQSQALRIANWEARTILERR
jgi:hypothetical protein